MWINWDVDELKADENVLKRLKEEPDYFKVGVQGLTSFPLQAFMNNRLEQ